LRKQGNRQVRSIEDEELDSVMKVSDTFVDQAVKELDLRAVYDALSVVDELEREILHLRFEEDLSFSDIAVMIGKSEGACKMILYRSIEKIRYELMRRTNGTV